MALVAGEFLSGGRVVDAFGRDSLKSEAVNAAPSAGSYISGGVRRDADGRICVAVETLNAAATAGTYLSGGRRFDGQGRLVVAVSAVALVSGEVLSGGEVTDSQGRVVVSNETLGAAYSAGDYNTGGGARSSLGRRLVAGAASANTFAAAVLALNPLLYWKLDDPSTPTAADASPNGRNGTYVAGVTLGQPSLLTHGAGNAVTASSANGVATSAYNPFTQDLSIGGWANLTNFTGQVTLFGSSNATNGPLLVLSNITGQPIWWSDLAAASVSWLAGDFPAATNVFWVLTWNNTTKTSELFINGSSKGTKVSANAFNATPGNFALAAASVAPGFRGPMDDTFIIPGILSGAQISALLAAA